MIQDIIQTLIHYQLQILDDAIWTQSINGKFTCSSAWELIRKNKQPDFSNRMTWHKRIILSGHFAYGEPSEINCQLMTRCLYLATPLYPDVSVALHMPMKLWITFLVEALLLVMFGGNLVA